MSSNDPARIARAVGLLLAAVAVLWGLSNCWVAVPPGHVAVAALFGKVQSQPYDEGFHFPVNPLFEFHEFDARQKTHMETAEVPTQDQLRTQIDVSVQYRIDRDKAAEILKDTGTPKDMIAVHLVPKLRSVLRDQGKTIRRAEDFFLEETQERLQASLEGSLRGYINPKGMEIQAVLIRDIRLPPFIMKAIEQKKEREQAVEKQKAELERFRYEQEQYVAQAEAERKAAEEEAGRRRVLADAQAYEIRQVTDAVANNPTYIQLQALETLKAMSSDKATKIYFLDGDSPTPLPLLNLADSK